MLTLYRSVGTWGSGFSLHLLYAYVKWLHLIGYGCLEFSFLGASVHPLQVFLPDKTPTGEGKCWVLATAVLDEDLRGEGCTRCPAYSKYAHLLCWKEGHSWKVLPQSTGRWSSKWKGFLIYILYYIYTILFLGSCSLSSVLCTNWSIHTCGNKMHYSVEVQRHRELFIYEERLQAPNQMSVKKGTPGHCCHLRIHELWWS